MAAVASREPAVMLPTHRVGSEIALCGRTVYLLEA